MKGDSGLLTSRPATQASHRAAKSGSPATLAVLPIPAQLSSCGLLSAHINSDEEEAHAVQPEVQVGQVARRLGPPQLDQLQGGGVEVWVSRQPSR